MRLFSLILNSIGLRTRGVVFKKAFRFFIKKARKVIFGLNLEEYSLRLEMQIFLLSKNGAQTLQLNKVISVTVLFVVVPAVSLAFYLGSQFSTSPVEAGERIALIEPLQQALNEQKEKIVALQKASQSDLNGLAVKLGQLQAQMLRVNAVGQRMAKMAGLGKKEFDFSLPPALGGLSHELDGDVHDETSIQASIRQLFVALQEKEQQLNALEATLAGKLSQKEFKPAGRPINKGWLSSYFGKRTDPFTGRNAWHHGVDFAGREGSDVVAMASGVVTWASERHNYGQMVEIDHGKGYVTRYGHNKELLVKVGDAVRQGDAIAKMGSTGRSTGPHVHLEVLRKGQKINPVKFIRASR